MDRFLTPIGNFEGIIDSIYEAAAIPDLWPSALERIGERVGMRGATLFAVDPDMTVRWTTSKTLADLVTRFISEGWMERNSRAAKLGPLRYPGFVGDLDLFTQEEMDKDPFYVELLRPIGLGWGAGTIILAPTEDVMVLTVEGSSGPVSRKDIAFLDQIRPHLCRAALLSSRLRMERARSAIEALEKLGLPAAALERNGRALLANEKFGKLDDRFALYHHRRLIRDRSANNNLIAALAAVTQGATSSACSLPVRGTAEHPPAIIHLVPICGAANDVFQKAMCIMIVTPFAPPRAPSSDLLHGLFDLTPAEARVARAIIVGQTVESFSSSLGVSRETVRAQLKSVFAKTGVQRQAELVALLVGKTLPLA